MSELLGPLRYHTADGRFYFYEGTDGQNVLAFTISEQARNFPTSFPHDADLWALLWRALASERRAYSLHGSIILSPDFRSWKGGKLLARLLQDVICICVRGRPSDMQAPNSAQETLKGTLTEHRDVRVYGDLSSRLGDAITNSAIVTLDECAGRLQHPIYGEPTDTWLYPKDFPTADGPDLVDLVDRFYLDPDSRDALGVYIASLFSAESLESPRPILLCSSWRQGHGKTIVQNCIAHLIDRKISNMSLRGDLDSKICASLVSGNRCLIASNATDQLDIAPLPMIMLSTDGGFEDRAKYQAETSTWYGVAPMVSVIVGAASFSEDMVSRMLHVELQGYERWRLPGDTADLFTKKNRDSIMASIGRGYAGAERGSYTFPDGCRFEAVISRGIDCWSVLSKRGPQDVASAVGRAMRSSRAFSTKGSLALLREHRDSFRIVSSAFQQQAFGASTHANEEERMIDGARALGWLRRRGAWERVADVPVPQGMRQL